MDRISAAKRYGKLGNRNADVTPQQEKEQKNSVQEKVSIYFSNDTILEFLKFLSYENWSQMRFLSRRLNLIIESNQTKLQAFIVSSVRMKQIVCSRNTLTCFNQAIPENAIKKWFRSRGYSRDDTPGVPLEKMFAGTDLSGNTRSVLPVAYNGLLLDIRAFFEISAKQNKPYTHRSRKTGRGPKMEHTRDDSWNTQILSSYSIPPRLFYTEFNVKYGHCGLILAHFFRLIHHPAAYFRKISIFPPMAEKFCDVASKNPIRCEKLTLYYLDSSLQHSLNWLKDNVCAKRIILSSNSIDIVPNYDLHTLVSEFLLTNASSCAKDRVKLDWLPHPVEFISNLAEKFETLEIKKAIPSIKMNNFPYGPEFRQYLDSKLMRQDDPTRDDKCCDVCIFESYELQNKMDESRKMIVQIMSCDECFFSEAVVNIRFE